MNYLRTIKSPIFWMVVVSILPSVPETILPEEYDAVLFNAARLALCVWAGWLVASLHTTSSLWASAWAGALLDVISHVVIKGGYFLLLGEYTAVAGVLISFVMFLWVPMAAAAAGGSFARSKSSAALNKRV